MRDLAVTHGVIFDIKRESFGSQLPIFDRYRAVGVEISPHQMLIVGESRHPSEEKVSEKDPIFSPPPEAPIAQIFELPSR